MRVPAIHFRFVPEDLDAGNPDQLAELFQLLRTRAIDDVSSLQEWLADESELLARIGAETARRYIAMTCHTEDEEARQRYLQMEREVNPKVKVWCDQLDDRFLASAALADLPAHYERLIRKRRCSKSLFRPENTALQTTESELQTRQQTIMGSLTARFQGQERTLQQLAPFYQDQDRGLRRDAYLAGLDARRPVWDELDRLFDELVALRTRMADNAGFPSYTPYRFQELHRFDYGPELCERFHASVEHAVVPAVQRLNRTRREKLGLPTLCPFDLDVDVDGGGPFQPFATETELIGLTRRIFTAVDARFATEFDVLQENALLDLMSRKGKAPGGYQYTLEDIRLPFIFCNSVGTHQDVQTLLHEGGHAFHAILSRDEPLLAYRDAPIEFAETASMSMELMGLEHLVEVYDGPEAARTRRRHLEGILRILPWIACIDAFQHWIYQNPGHDHEARGRAWLQVLDRFETGIDYSAFPDARLHRWKAQGHLFQHAFYYIEYGIAQIAALQIWRAYRRDRKQAVEAYRAGLALGGSRSLPDLMRTAGATFDVTTETMADLVADIEAQMAV